MNGFDKPAARIWGDGPNVIAAPFAPNRHAFRFAIGHDFGSPHPVCGAIRLPAFWSDFGAGQPVAAFKAFNTYPEGHYDTSFW